MSEIPPVLILGCHRSGTSAITGLLHHAAGLVLGDVLPATRDNPKGYFESLAVVKAHRSMLGEMGRDWTCPPVTFEPDEVDVSALVDALAPMKAQSIPWGVKDPRLLFMLPAWANMLNSMRFIGVIRNPGSITKSIVKRDGLPQAAAERIVSLYIRRLADLHQLLPFPVIDFDDDPDKTLERLELASRGLGLEWDSQEARLFFSPGLVHYRSQLSADENYHYLLGAANEPVSDVPVYSSGDVTNAIANHRLVDLETLPTTFGPRYMERRRAALRYVLSDEEAVEGLLELVPAASATEPLVEGRFDIHDTVQVPSRFTSLQARLARVVPPTHVMATGIVDDLSDEMLGRLLAELEIRTRPNATMFLESPRGRVEAVESSVTNTTWKLAEAEDASSTHKILTLTKDSNPMAYVAGSGDPQTVLLSLDSRISALERDRALTASRTQHTELRKKRADIESLTKQVEKLQLQLERTNERYERLASRRSVRIALRLAESLKPVVKRLRPRP